MPVTPTPASPSNVSRTLVATVARSGPPCGPPSARAGASAAGGRRCRARRRRARRRPGRRVAATAAPGITVDATRLGVGSDAAAPRGLRGQHVVGRGRLAVAPALPEHHERHQHRDAAGRDDRGRGDGREDRERRSAAERRGCRTRAAHRGPSPPSGPAEPPLPPSPPGRRRAAGPPPPGSRRAIAPAIDGVEAGRRRRRSATAELGRAVAGGGRRSGPRCGVGADGAAWARRSAGRRALARRAASASDRPSASAWDRASGRAWAWASAWVGLGRGLRRRLGRRGRVGVIVIDRPVGRRGEPVPARATRT